MTTDQAVRRAINHMINGNRSAAVAALAPALEEDSDTAFQLVAALAEAAVAPDRDRVQPGEAGTVTAFHAGQRVNVDDAPPPIRLALRLMAARLNDDEVGLRALFDTADEGLIGVALAVMLQRAARPGHQRRR